LSPYARAGLNALVDAGVLLTIASARSLTAMRALLAGVRLSLPVIELNGAYLSDWETGRRLESHPLDPGLAEEAVRSLAASGADPVLTTWDGAADRVLHRPRNNHGSAWFVAEKQRRDDPRLAVCEDLRAAAATQAVAVITAFAPSPEAAGLAVALGEALGAGARVTAAAHGYVHGWTEINVAHPEADKGLAITALTARLGLAGTPVTACGDHLNDLGMFQAAQRGVAPANAQPEVLALAAVVTESNDSDGIVRFLLDENDLPAPSTPCTSP